MLASIRYIYYATCDIFLSVSALGCGKNKRDMCFGLAHVLIFWPQWGTNWHLFIINYIMVPTVGLAPTYQASKARVLL